MWLDWIQPNSTNLLRSKRTIKVIKIDKLKTFGFFNLSIQNWMRPLTAKIANRVLNLNVLTELQMADYIQRPKVKCFVFYASKVISWTREKTLLLLFWMGFVTMKCFSLVYLQIFLDRNDKHQLLNHFKLIKLSPFQL